MERATHPQYERTFSNITPTVVCTIGKACVV